METITGGISIRLAGRLDTIGDHLFGGIFIVGALFFRLFTLAADGVMIVNR